jgi:hypothetical protein
MFKKGDKVVLSKGFYFGLPSTAKGIVKKSNKKYTTVSFNQFGVEEVETKHLKLLGEKRA